MTYFEELSRNFICGQFFADSIRLGVNVRPNSSSVVNVGVFWSISDIVTRQAFEPVHDDLS